MFLERFAGHIFSESVKNWLEVHHSYINAIHLSTPLLNSIHFRHQHSQVIRTCEISPLDTSTFRKRKLEKSYKNLLGDEHTISNFSFLQKFLLRLHLLIKIFSYFQSYEAPSEKARGRAKMSLLMLQI